MTAVMSHVSSRSNRRRPARRVLLALAMTGLLMLVSAAAAAGWFGWQSPPAEGWTAVAPGVAWRQYSHPEWLDPSGPVQVFALRIDPAAARVSSALAEGRTPALESVPSLASRLGVVAAVNAGFFGPNGRPAGVLKQDGRWIGTSGDRARGAVGLVETTSGTHVLFGQLRASLTVRAHRRAARRGAAARTLTVDHLNPSGRPAGLAWYSPAFGEITFGAAPPASEAQPQSADAPASPGAPAPGARPSTPAAPLVALVCDGTPCRVVERVTRAPRTGTLKVPAGGAVLLARGQQAIRKVRGLGRGTVVEVVPTLHVERGDADGWAEARDIIGGAGLLMKDGARVTDWTPERFRTGFDTERHPRTIIGVDREGRIWLVVVDGRRPDWSLGMRFDELQAMSERLGLVDVLNLDGGGSTTMVVKGEIVNRPTDLIGPRRVSDALVVR